MSTQQISFAIEGMRRACAKCTGDIQHALTELDGVVAAQVNYASERATVVYDPARVAACEMVNAIRRVGYDTPREQQTLHSDDLLYATSARTVEKVLGNVQGVVQTSANLPGRSVAVHMFPEYARHGDPERLFNQLGFQHLKLGSPDARRVFVFRSGVLVMIDLLAIWSAGAHAGWLVSASSSHAPLALVMLSLAALFGAGLPFYRLAYTAVRQGEFDASVIVALLASAFALGSLLPAITSASPWLTDIGFTMATTLTAGWFITRALTLWVSPHFSDSARNAKPLFIPVLAGMLATLLMLSIYLGTLSALQSPAHALEQLASDGVWVGLVAFGFGTQIGLYTYLRLVIHAAKAAGATAMTGAGTGTSTLGMLACCAHHLTDIAPLIGLTGTSGLSVAIGFFTEWKYAFIALGLAMNAIGIVVTLRTVQKHKAHLEAVIESATRVQAVPACH